MQLSRIDATLSPTTKFKTAAASCSAVADAEVDAAAADARSVEVIAQAADIAAQRCRCRLMAGGCVTGANCMSLKLAP